MAYSRPSGLPDDPLLECSKIIGDAIHRMIVSGAFEFTPEGIKMTLNVQPSKRIIEATGQRLDFLIIGTPVLASEFVKRVEAIGVSS